MDLPSLFAEFIMDRKAAGLSSATIKWYVFWSERLIAFLRQRGLSLEANEVTPRIIREFIVDLQKAQASGQRRVSPATINNAFRALRAFFRWAEQEGRISSNPMSRLREPKMPQKAPPAFTREEMARLLKTAATWGSMRERNYAILILLFDTGIRLSELTGLTLSSVFLDEGYIRVRGKGAKERLIPLGQAARRALRRYIREVRGEAQTDVLFLTRDRKPLKNSGVQSLLKRIGKAAGVKGVSPHKFRHTFAKEYLLNGGDLESLRRMLGHTSLEMARRYIHLIIDDLELIHRKASPVDNLLTGKNRGVELHPVDFSLR